MIPQVAVITVHSGRHRRRLWVPLLPLWLVLLPFAVLVVPFFLVGCLVARVRPVRALSGIWQVLVAVKGAQVDVTRGATSTSIGVR